MSKRSISLPVCIQVSVHVAMGAALGLTCALLLPLLGREDLLLEQAGWSAWVLAGVITTQMAVGAGLTGFLLIAAETDRR